MRSILFFSFTALLLCSFGCDPKKDPAPVPVEEQDFSCIKLFDEQGQTWGIHGSCTSSDDWGKITLSSSEQTFLNFSDTVSYEGTVAASISFLAIAPCPVKIEQAFRIYLVGPTPDQFVKVKIAVVDESLNVVQQLAVKVQTGNGIALYMDPSKFESGKYYRMYYRISSGGVASLYEGYGNFLVCKTYIDGVNTTIESDCL
jgi:hypothetical protein